MNIRYPLYEGVYRILTYRSGCQDVFEVCCFFQDRMFKCFFRMYGMFPELFIPVSKNIED